MDFFDKYKALIITVLLFLVILLGMYNIQIANHNAQVQEMLVQLQNYEFEEPTKQKNPEKPPETAGQKSQTSVETHEAFNQNLEENQEEFQSRLNEIFEESAAEQEASEEGEETTDGRIAINSNNDEKSRNQSDGDGSTDEISAQSGILENSSISFNLLGRQAIDIPNPIYTCDTAGKIVVNITVNARGEVTSTSINEASSSTTNECLTHQALLYAKDAIFTELAGRNHQLGTITYNFQD
ncbi:MAG TPA: hypothetical protein VFI78_05585 [Salinimicrobium sp.]|nr:hypothetical protein [Salinimicrobium sp.]